MSVDAQPRRAAPRRRPAAAVGGTGSAGPAERAEGRKLHDFVAHRLGSDIIGGVHPPGALLPNEGALRARFGVSRTALREAYRVLSAKGLIVSRTKVGTRVRPKADWNMLDPDVLAWHLQEAPSEDFIAHLFQLRQMVEPAAAALAARSRAPDTVARIAAAFADMERYKDGSGDLVGADLRFHQAILEATGNHFVGALGGLIHAALVSSFRLGWESATFMQESRLRGHAAVLQAIRERKPRVAQARMAALLRDSMGDVRRLLRKRRHRARR